jgi:peptidoglycan endopeptidase LytE
MEENMSAFGRYDGTLLATILVSFAIALLLLTSPPAKAQSVPRTDKLRKHLKKRAHSVLGAPYVYGGSSPSGFDCSGFTLWVFERHTRGLPHSALGQFLLGKKDAYKRIWKRKNLKVGDLVFYKTTGAMVGHAGMYVGHSRFISATSSSGVRGQPLRDSYWGPRWVGGTRVPALIRE